MIDGLPTESASYTLHDPIFYLPAIPPPQNQAILVKHQTNLPKGNLKSIRIYLKALSLLSPSTLVDGPSNSQPLLTWFFKLLA